MFGTKTTLLLGKRLHENILLFLRIIFVKVHFEIKITVESIRNLHKLSYSAILNSEMWKVFEQTTYSDTIIGERKNNHNKHANKEQDSNIDRLTNIQKCSIYRTFVDSRTIDPI